jgi:DME family drug/metabolite transporter
MNKEPKVKRKFPTVQGTWMVLFAAALWGTTGTSQALTPEASTPGTIAALRMLIAGTAMLFWVTNHDFRLSNWPWGKTLLAGASIAIYQFASFSAMAATGVAVGAIVAMGTAPIFAGVLEFFVRKKTPLRFWYLSTFLAVLGCCFLLFSSENNIQIDKFGIFLALVAGFFYASYTLLISLFVDDHPPQVVTAIVTCTGGLFLLPLLFKANLEWLTEINGWLVMLYLGLIATALSYWLFATGLKTVQTSTAVTLTLAEPLIATLLGISIVGERLGIMEFCGLFLIFIALFLIMIPVQRCKMLFKFSPTKR